MKKEKSLNFLSSKWMMSALLAFGILFCSNTTFAQNGPFADKINHLTQLRNTFAPSTAKYDIVQDAIDYVLVLEQQYIANPNAMNDLADQTGQDPMQADKIRKTHPTILANYTAAQLAQFQTLMGEYTSGTNQDPVQAQKAQWVLDANAY